MKKASIGVVLLMITTHFWSIGAKAQTDLDVQALADRWTQAYNSHNPAGLSGLYAENANLMMHGSPTIKGRQAIGDFWVEDFKEGNPITTLRVTHEVRGVDMILVHGSYQVIDRNDGLLLGQGRFAHIWMLEGDDWMLDRDMWNQPFNPYPGR